MFAFNDTAATVHDGSGEAEAETVAGVNLNQSRTAILMNSVQDLLDDWRYQVIKNHGG